MTAGKPSNKALAWLLAASILISACSLVRSRSLPPLPDLPEGELKALAPAVRDQIREAFQKAQANPNDAEANGQLGMTLQAYELYQDATRCYQRARLLDPKSFTWAYYLATSTAATGANPAVVDLLQEVLRLNPDYLPARLKLAESLLAIGKLEECRRVSDKLLEQSPGSARAQYVAGRAKAAQGEIAAAVENYKTACELAPHYASAHYALSLAYRQLGDATKAEEQLSLYRQSQAWVPPVEDPVLEKLESLKAGAYDYLNKGKRLQDDGQLQEALQQYRLALQANPRMLQAHVNLITVYGALGDLEEARKHYQTAIEIDPNKPWAYYNYGMVLINQKQFKEAEKAFRHSLEMDPSVDAHVNLGQTLESQGRLDEAEASYRRALTAQPNHREAHFYLARVLEKRGKFPEAIRHLQEILSPEEARTPVFMYYLSIAYAQVGDREKALHYAQEAQRRAGALGQTELAGAVEKLLQLIQQKGKQR